MERIWGGQRLHSEFGKKLPIGADIGESWEIVDREDAQSIVRHGVFRDHTLHELWTRDRESIFGHVPDCPSSPRDESASPRRPDRTGVCRFPLLIKLLDAHEKLSLQVHPPEHVADSLGGEPKTEFWYVAAAEPGARLFVGLQKPTSRKEFEEAIRIGKVADLVHTISAKPGDAILLPAGRFHAVGDGNLLVEVQQNSDTTYRVFDWNRVDESSGRPRPLHVDQALQSIDFNDVTPGLIQPDGELLVRHRFFEVQKWDLVASREVAPPGQFAIVGCLTGAIRCVDVDLAPGEFCLVPASLVDRELHPRADGTTLLRITIPPALR